MLQENFIHDIAKETVLKERILNFINLNKQGISMIALENEFGESRMRLGYIINKLLDEDEILKSNTKFYPKTTLGESE